MDFFLQLTSIFGTKRQKIDQNKKWKGPQPEARVA